MLASVQKKKKKKEIICMQASSYVFYTYTCTYAIRTATINEPKRWVGGWVSLDGFPNIHTARAAYVSVLEINGMHAGRLHTYVCHGMHGVTRLENDAMGSSCMPHETGNKEDFVLHSAWNRVNTVGFSRSHQDHQLRYC